MDWNYDRWKWKWNLNHTARLHSFTYHHFRATITARMALVHFSTHISHICLCAYCVIDGDWLLVRSLEQKGVQKANPLSVSWDLAIDFFPLSFTGGPDCLRAFFSSCLTYLTWDAGDFWSGRFNGYGWHFVRDFYSARWTFYYYSSVPIFLANCGSMESRDFLTGKC